MRLFYTDYDDLWRSLVMLDSPTRVCLCIAYSFGCSIAQTTENEDGSRITRRNDHRKAVTVPRSISANI
jgi:hypothetical protein